MARQTMAWFGLPWLALTLATELTGSVRGEHGLAVCATVTLATLAVERYLTRAPLGQLVTTLGFRAPPLAVVGWTAALVVLLGVFFACVAWIGRAPLMLHPNALCLAAGVFAQGGIAEELVFRGFLFRRLRAGRSFWSAAGLGAIPFIAVHMLLLRSLPLPIALGALLLEVSIGVPLAWLYERGRFTVWLPAIVHAVVQGVPKLIEAPSNPTLIPVSWLAFTAVAPWLLLLMRPHGAGHQSR